VTGYHVTFGGVPAWLLADYLVDLGGDRVGEDRVVGEGWTATLERHAKPPGSLTIGRVTVTVEGTAAARIIEQLREKAQRGGG
jgi:hypothetical protein